MENAEWVWIASIVPEGIAGVFVYPWNPAGLLPPAAVEVQWTVSFGVVRVPSGLKVHLTAIVRVNRWPGVNACKVAEKGTICWCTWLLDTFLPVFSSSFFFVSLMSFIDLHGSVSHLPCWTRLRRFSLYYLFGNFFCLKSKTKQLSSAPHYSSSEAFNTLKQFPSSKLSSGLNTVT